jgi:hypothetical protein
MKLAKTFFSNLTIFSRTSSVDVTYEGVALFALARLGGVAHVRASMWRHVGLSCASPVGTTESRRLLWHDWQPSRLAPHVHQSGWRD